MNNTFPVKSYLFLAFVLETQACCSFLETVAIVCPGLVRFELHFESILPPSKRTGKTENGWEEGSKELTAEPPHRCCSLHPWSVKGGGWTRVAGRTILSFSSQNQKIEVKSPDATCDLQSLCGRVPRAAILCRLQPTQHSPPLDPFAHGRWLSTMNRQAGGSDHSSEAERSSLAGLFWRGRGYTAAQNTKSAFFKQCSKLVYRDQNYTFI